MQICAGVTRPALMMPVKVCLYRTRHKLKSFIQNATAEHDFSLFYLDQRRKPRSRSRSV